MIRYATIGTNFITDRFVESAAKCPELTYAAVYSRTREKAESFADKYGVSKIYTSLEKMAEDEEIDAVYVASPSYLHCTHSILMMKHGKHVICEKPVASNYEELKHMIAAAKENNVVFMEAMRSVLDPGFAAIQENLPKLGTIRRATLQYCQYSSRYDKFKNGIIENAFRPELSNGALMDIGVYCVHALVKLFGMPKKIYADGIFLENGVDGAGSILAGYGHMQAEIIYSKITDSSLASQIQGENANMVIDKLSDIKEITIYYRNGETEKIVIDREKNNMFYEAKEWARLIEGGKTGEIHTRYSEMEMQLMDEVRNQTGIVFPADKEKRWEV